MDWPMPTEAEGAVLYQMFDGHVSRFPRPEFMRRQQEHLRKVQERCAAERSEPKTIVPAAVAEPAEQAQEASEEGPIPETVEELKGALRDARAEAARWKRAYEQYHRITHGN